MRHGGEVHARVIDGRSAKGHIARRELNAVLIDIEAAEHILHETFVQGTFRSSLLISLASPTLRLDGLERRHEQRPGSTRGVDDPESRDRFRVRPVSEIATERELRQHHRRQVVRIERPVAFRRAENAVVERPCVVVAKIAQGIGDAVGALGVTMRMASSIAWPSGKAPRTVSAGRNTGA